MSDIRQVDAAFHTRRVLAERSPAQDFAYELAKTSDGKIMDNVHPHHIHTVEQPTRTVANAPKSSVDVSHVVHAFSWASAVAAADVDAQEQLRVAVQPTGVTEELLGSRVYGVHLLASTYLSELTTRGEPDPEALPVSTLPAMASAPSQSDTEISDVPSVLNGTTRDTSADKEVISVLSLLVKDEATEATNHTQSSSSVSAASVEASAMCWPESSLRLTRQRDGTAVIWLRDYRISNEGTSQLVDVLVKETQTAGIRLGRIVLNGREVWTSPKNY